MNTHKLTLLLFLAIIVSVAACKKKKDPHVPPDVKFKTGGNYVSGDVTKAQGDSILVGVVVTKTEDDLKSYNVSYAYDGAGTTTTFYNYLMNSSEYNVYSKDLYLHLRNQAGSERWVFSIVDRDGNITQKTITVTVQ